MSAILLPTSFSDRPRTMTVTDIKKNRYLPPLGTQSGRVPNATYLRTFLLQDAMPDDVSFMDNRMVVDGMPGREHWPEDLAWGVHGTSSMGDAHTAMLKAAKDRTPNTHVWQIDLWLRINDVKRVAATIDQAAAMDTGFLIVPRLRSDYKLEVFKEMVAIIEASMSQAKAKKDVVESRLQHIRDNWTLDKLLLQYPTLVWKFMEANPWIAATVYQASVQIPNVRPYSAQFQMVTFRVDPKSVIGAGVRENDKAKVRF